MMDDEPLRRPSQDRPTAAPVSAGAPLVDPFGRAIRYVRVSVTDRCDLRCLYCMPERMQFLPRAEVLTLEELDRLCAIFIGLGTRKLRLTGGEPLVRKGFISLVEGLSRHLTSGALDELTLTTNATRLSEFAGPLAAAGVRRINVSLDSLEPETFSRITRGGDLAQVIRGLDAAQAAGLKIKLNTVALARDNRAEIPAILAFAHGRGLDLTLIETMPIGEVEQDRTDQFVSLAEVRQDLAAVWTLTDIPDQTGGPARYVRVEETGGRLGFITPLSHTFCEACNRVRLTCTGTLHTCLGQEDATDLRAALRAYPDDDGPVIGAVRAAIAFKPKGHDFHIGRGAAPAVARHMSTTGGLGVMARVLLFGPLRDLAGWRERAFDPVPATLFALRAALTAEDPALGEALARPGVQAAVDKALVRGDTPLAAGAEVAFLPPMSGG